MRIKYEMTEEELADIMKACRPVPAIMLQCGTPSSQQENANNAWAVLGKKRGFAPMSVRPVPGKPNGVFEANETVSVFMDGDMFCATRLDFINLQESTAGFGKTKEEAIACLYKEEDKDG